MLNIEDVFYSADYDFVFDFVLFGCLIHTRNDLVWSIILDLDGAVEQIEKCIDSRVRHYGP